MSFKDLFSTQAADYSKYRPHYPDSLFQYLAGLCPARNAAWDCGAGNGQAAIALADHFATVYATEPSEKQLAQAVSHPKVKYSQARAESSGLADYSVNLVTVAQAFHWFSQPEFFREVRRVAEPGGVLAVWCYGIATVDEDFDMAMMRLYQDILGAYWDQGRRLVEEGYRNEKFPYNELQPPPFEMEVRWNLPQLLGYFSTWSALAKYKKEKGTDPLGLVEQEFLAAWGDPAQKKKVTWPLGVRVFQVT